MKRPRLHVASVEEVTTHYSQTLAILIESLHGKKYIKSTNMFQAAAHMHHLETAKKKSCARNRREEPSS